MRAFTTWHSATVPHSPPRGRALSTGCGVTSSWVSPAVRRRGHRPAHDDGRDTRCCRSSRLTSTPSRRRLRSTSGVSAVSSDASRSGSGYPNAATIRGSTSRSAAARVRFVCVETNAVAFASAPAVYGVYAPVFCDSGVAAFARDADRVAAGAGSRSPAIPATRTTASTIAISASTCPTNTSVRTCRRPASAWRPASSTTASPTRAIARSPTTRARARDRRASRRALRGALHVAGRGRGPGSRPSAAAHGAVRRRALRPLVARRPALARAAAAARSAARIACAVITPDEYLDAYPTNQVAEPNAGTWGAGGHLEVWLTDATEWMLSPPAPRRRPHGGARAVASPPPRRARGARSTRPPASSCSRRRATGRS